MKHKRILTLILIPCLFLFLSPRVSAVTPDDFREFSGSDQIYDLLPEGLDREEMKDFVSEQDSSQSVAKILDTILELVSIGIRDSLTLFSGLCLLLLLSALFEAVKQNFSSGVESAFDFFFLLAVSLFCFSFLEKTVLVASDAVQNASSFMLSCLPITSLLLAMGGSVGAGAVQSAATGFVVSGVSTIASTFLLPTVRILFCFSFLEGMGENSLGRILSFFKKSVKVVCIFFFLLVTGTLSIQNSLASATDSLAMRSVRFAAANFIPVVGSLVGENTKVLSASLSVVKTECGILCLAALLFILLRPILTIVIQKTFFSMAAAMGEILGENRCKKFLTSISQVMDLILALLFAQGCYLIFAITLFINTKGNL